MYNIKSYQNLFQVVLGLDPSYTFPRAHEDIFCFSSNKESKTQKYSDYYHRKPRKPGNIPIEKLEPLAF